MKPEIEHISQRALAALFDGTWQGLLIVAAVWVILKFSRRANAATRYAAWMATLLILAVLPIAYFSVPSVDKIPVLDETASTEVEVAPLPELTQFEVNGVRVDADPSLETEVVATPSRTWHFSLPKNYSSYLVGIWAALALIRLGALAFQLLTLHRIKRKAVLAGGPLVQSFAAIHREMRVARPAFLLSSVELQAPMVIGFQKACVLLPAALCEQASRAQLEHVLRHELAHLARRDDWANLIQQAIHAVFFFHPGVRFASRRLTMEREIACDDHAIAATAARKDYALFLTEFASRVRGRDFTAAPAAWSHTSQLKERISMILDGKRNSSPRLARARAAGITAGALLLALLAFQIAPRLSVAGETDKEVTATAEKTSTVETDINGDVTITRTTETATGPKVAVVTATAARPAIATTVSVAPLPAIPGRPGAPVGIIGAPPSTPRAPMLVAQADGPRPKHKRDGGDDDSIERRLDRLERLVERIAKDKDKPAKFDGDKNNFTPKMAKPMRDDDEWNHMRDEMRRNKEQAERERDHAMRERDRVMRDQERAIHEIEKQAHQAAEDAARAAGQANRGQETLKAKREALQRVRRNIDQQLEALQRQIEQQDKQERQEKQEKQERIDRPERKEKEKSPEDNSPKK